MSRKIRKEEIPSIEILTKEQCEILEHVCRAYAKYYKQKCEDVR